MGLLRRHGCCTSPQTPTRQTSVNRFAVESQGDGLYCFGSVYPYAENALQAMEEIKASGLYGVKLHPDYQEFFIGDEAALALYAQSEKLGAARGLPHRGGPPLPPPGPLPPGRAGKIADLFPKLTIIAAHMGGMDMPQEAARHLAKKPNVYFDTAFASHFLDAAGFTELVKLRGADHVLFATDSPWSTLPAEKALLEAADLTPRGERGHRL